MKKQYKRLYKLLGKKKFLKLTPDQRKFMAQTWGSIKLPWIGRFYTDKDFD